MSTSKPRSIGNIDVVRSRPAHAAHVRREMTTEALRLRKLEEKYATLADRARISGSLRYEAYLMLAHAYAQAARRFEVDVAMLKS